MVLKIPQIGKNLSWAWLSFLLNAIAAFFITPFMIRTLGNATFGIWVLLGSVLGYYSVLNLGFDTAVIRHVAKHIGEKNEQAAADVLSSAQTYFRTIGLLVLSLSALATALFAFADPVFHFFSIPPEIRTDFSIALLLLGSTTALSFYMRIWDCVLKAYERYDLPSIVSVAILIFRTGCLLLFMKSSLLSLAIIFASFSLLNSGAIWAAGVSTLRAQGLPRGHFCRDQFRRIGRFGLFAFFTSVADQFRSNTDPMVIARFMQMAQVTHYNISFTIIRYFRLIAGQFGAPFLPLFSRFHGRNQGASLIQLFLVASKMQAFLTMLIAGAILGCGGDFIRFWVGTELGLDNLPICTHLLTILLIPMMLDVMQSLSNTLLYSLNRHPFFSYQTATEGCANLVLSILLAPRYGLIGVAWGTAIPMIITKLFVQPWYVCRVAEIPFGSYLRDCVLIPVAGTVLLGAGLHVFLIAVAPQNMVFLLLQGGAVTAAFALLSSWGMLRKKDRAYIRNAFQARSSL